MIRVKCYTVSGDGKRLTCHLCGFTSLSPRDIAARWCGHCRVFLQDIDDATSLAIRLGVIRTAPLDLSNFLRRVKTRLCGIGRP